MAVYTVLSNSDVQTILDQYDLPALISYEGIWQGIENTNYRVLLKDKTIILTLFEGRTDISALPFVLKYIDQLDAHGLPVPSPLANQQNRTIGHYGAKSLILVPFLEGKSAEPSDLDLCHNMGATLAEMHRATEDYSAKRSNPLNLDGMQELLDKLGPDLNQISDDLNAELQDEMECLNRLCSLGLPEGVIHTDLFPDNVLTSDSRVTGLIDFYFSGTDAFIYDLAVTLSAWSFDDDMGFSEQRHRAILAGYVFRRSLADNEKDALPVMLRRASLRFLLTRAQDWLKPPDKAFVDRKDPMDFLRRLRFYREIGNLPGL